MREETLIQTIRAHAGAPDRAADFEDDVATLNAGGSRTIATVDALVEGVHFLPSDPIGTVARKLVRVNVSDILSKGASPAEALLTLGWPADRSERELADFAEALGQELRDWQISLVGGDTVRTPERLVLSLMLTGVCHGRAPIRRAGGRTGDALWVTGVIGAGVLGLEAALQGTTGNGNLAHYRVPDLPPATIADLIARHANASMDVSDGLLGDALKLADASGCGVLIDLASVPLAEPTGDLERRLRQVTGGDDYQALFSAAPGHRDGLLAGAEAAGIRITEIGNLQSGAGLTLLNDGVTCPLPPTLSFTHGAD